MSAHYIPKDRNHPDAHLDRAVEKLIDMAEAGVNPKRWRVGKKIPLNVYEGNRPVCQCHGAEDARRIVEAMNVVRAMKMGKAIA